LYYYHDFDNFGIRLIVLNPFDDGNPIDQSKWKPIEYDGSLEDIHVGSYQAGDKVNVEEYTEYSFEAVENITVTNNYIQGDPKESNENLPSYKVIRANRWFGEVQLLWFVNTLKGASIKGYNVIVAQHFSFTPFGVYDDNYDFTNPNHDTQAIFQYNNRFFHYEGGNLVTTADADIIAKIVDAYLNKTALSNIAMNPYLGVDGRFPPDGEYRISEVEGAISGYTFSCDFSQMETEPTIVTHIGGHYHLDYIYSNLGQTGIVFISGVVQNFLTRRDIFRNNDDAGLTVYTMLENGKVHLCRLDNDVSTKVSNRKLIRKDNEVINI
jgi:hypothetical protein